MREIYGSGRYEDLPLSKNRSQFPTMSQSEHNCFADVDDVNDARALI
jgi:hypothetical protein